MDFAGSTGFDIAVRSVNPKKSIHWIHPGSGVRSVTHWKKSTGSKINYNPVAKKIHRTHSKRSVWTLIADVLSWSGEQTRWLDNCVNAQRSKELSDHRNRLIMQTSSVSVDLTSHQTITKRINSPRTSPTVTRKR